MTIQAQDATGAKVNMSTTVDASGNAVGSTCITDPVSGAKQNVLQTHNLDQQTVPNTSFSGLSSGVALLQDAVGNVVNRQRELGLDNASPLGIVAGGSYLVMIFKTTCSQNLASGVNQMTLAAVSGTMSGVPWKIQQGSKLTIDIGGVQETLTVQAVNTSTKVVTFTSPTSFAHNGSGTPFILVGITLNQARDAAGENDGASGSGTAVAAEYEFNGGDPSGGNYDRARSINAKGFVTQTINSGGGVGSGTITLAANIGLQPGIKVMLYKASAFPAASFFESVNIDIAYVPGSNTVPLASTIVGSAGYDTIAYDGFAALGPQLKPFLPFGIGIETLGLYDTVAGLMYALRNAPGHQGAVLVSSDGAKATYRYAGTMTPAATPTDIITITGSSTRTGRIKSIVLGGLASTGNSMALALIRRSTANTGGTKAAASGGAHDINDPSATIIPQVYSANATGLGVAVGSIGQGRLWLGGVINTPFQLRWDFSTRQDKALILRGTSDIIAINLAGATVPSGGVIDFEIEIEEDVS